MVASLFAVADARMRCQRKNGVEAWARWRRCGLKKSGAKASMLHAAVSRNPSIVHHMTSRRNFRDTLLVLCAFVTCFLYPTHSFTTPFPRSPSSFITEQCSNSHVRLSAALSSEGGADTSQDFFIRSALPADVGTASTILADGFFGDKNFFTYQFEKLRTYLSLESDFPKRSEQHKMYVACRSTDGKVIAVCDIDNRPFLIKRPYMCNLAVCRKWRNQGLAKALVAKCEEQVLEWDHTELHLKARQINGAAVSLYKSLGYEVESEAFDMEYMDHLVVMRKSITRQAKYQGDASEKEAVFGAAERSLSSRS